MRIRAAAADGAALARARRPKSTRLAINPLLLADVRGRLEQDWSPEQIAAWLRREHPTDRSRWISHETIYRPIDVAGRRELGPRAARRRRGGRTMRHPRLVRGRHGHGRLRNLNSSDNRHAVVTERIEVGHWEGDLVMGKRPSAVAAPVERHTRDLRIVPLPHGYKADTVRRALTDDLAQLPPAMRRSLTRDRGGEGDEDQELAAHLGLDVYVRDPRGPWQRGSSKHTNRLLRQDPRKNADLQSFSMRDLDNIAARVNTRPQRLLRLVDCT